MPDKKYTIAIVGNPNCGKTTLFNGLTGNTHTVGNWPGVTVEKKEGKIKNENVEINVVDLPGIYSLSAYSEDERISRDFILSHEADLIVNIVDASNIERNLYLTTHLLEMKVPVLLVFNMKDVAVTKDIHLNIQKVIDTLKVPSIYVSAVKKDDLKKIKDSIISAVDKKRISGVNISYEDELEDEINAIEPIITSVSENMGANSRWFTIKLLEGDEQLEKMVGDANILTETDIHDVRHRIEKRIGDEVDVSIADGRYGFVHGLVSLAVKRGAPQKTITEKIDNVVLNRILGIPIFFAVMYLVFWATISLGGAFIDFFDIIAGAIFVDGLETLLNSIGAPAWISAFFATGIGGGLQTIATFVPIIFMLFFMLSLLEDSGYMARAAFVMDRLMRIIGLPGKAFIPMLVGFGCTVPAIMATRTLENRRDRILTIFMAPFMSCGARLPVYALFAAAFFPQSGQNIVFLLYIIGIVLAVLTGILLKNTLFKGESAPFVMELPLYHTPRLGHVFIHTWSKLKGFVLKAGKVLIIIITILGFLNSLGTDGSFGNEDAQNSVLSVAGKAVTPLFSSFGIEKDNWPAAVGLFTGLFAKEVVVGTINSLYSSMGESDEGNNEEEDEFFFWGSIGEAFGTIPVNVADLFALEALVDPLGVNIGDVSEENSAAEELEVEPAVFKEMRKRFRGGGFGAFAYLLFVLLYVPCLVAVGAAFKEMGWKLTLFQAVYSTMLAWVLATLFFQVTVGHSAIWIISSLFVLFLSVSGIYFWAHKNSGEIL